MNDPFEEVSADSELGIRVLYHCGYDQHYIRSESQAQTPRWYEASPLTVRIVSLSEKEQAALEEQFQNALTP